MKASFEGDFGELVWKNEASFFEKILEKCPEQGSYDLADGIHVEIKDHEIMVWRNGNGAYKGAGNIAYKGAMIIKTRGNDECISYEYNGGKVYGNIKSKTCVFARVTKEGIEINEISHMHGAIHEGALYQVGHNLAPQPDVMYGEPKSCIELLWDMTQTHKIEFPIPKDELSAIIGEFKAILESVDKMPEDTKKTGKISTDEIGKATLGVPIQTRITAGQVEESNNTRDNRGE